MSYFAPRYGFVCDQVVNYEIVLANGTAVDSNAENNSDLWFALKGGSNNFGVVTRFDLKTFPLGKFWGGTICNSIDTLPAQIQAFADLNSASNYDTNVAITNTYAFARRIGLWTVANLLVYTERKVNPQVLRPFIDIKPQLANTMRVTNLGDLTTDQVLAVQSIQWAHANDDGIINEVARSIWAQADELAMRMGLQRKWIYLNYANPGPGPDW
ncbi:MAG: hypothetical protein Q9192_005281 [Flavoplaca navasiana]